MKLIIAEKPSVARDIARVVGATERVNGKDITYYRGGGYLVGNAMGHFLGLSEPSTYGFKWGIAELPMLPQKFTLSPVENHAGRLKALIKLMNSKDVDSLICATDAGREGEVIFRYIYYFSGCRKPFTRLWISSLTDESIQNGMRNLQPGADKDRVFQAGFTRAKADWLVGMNLSRLYMLLYRQKYTVGRVQTPTLAMIAQRDFDIAGFKKTPFYTLTLENGAKWFDKNDKEVASFPDKASAVTVQLRCEGKTATVVKADTKRKTENRPLLYSLTSLQKDANEKHGFSAARTLVTMQDLYEKKLLTYPRTDSNYLTDDMKGTCAELVEKLSFFDSEYTAKLTSQGLNLDKRVIDNSKVADHHAIIPTGNIVKITTTELTADEKIITDMVMTRFLAALDQPHIYDETEYVFDVFGELFKLVTKISVTLGWRDYCKNEEKNVSEFVKYSLNEMFVVSKIILSECETQPPKPFTESTLLSAMENISRRIEDESKREFVKERGLGTPATRAAIIEGLLKRGFIERKKKQMFSTEAGREFLKLLPDEIKNVEMTADIESLLSDIESGKSDVNTALSEVMRLVTSVVEAEKVKAPAVVPPEKTVLGKCPKCGGDVIEVKTGFVCTNKERCVFSLWKNDFFWSDRKKELTAEMVALLLKNGAIVVTGLYSKKKDTKYNACVSLEDVTGKDGKLRIGYKMEFDGGK
ncbi:DNA topoisomerase [Clostridia bacterium]|nr:DNA topoisomerase [Clostridia bacterium]